MIEFDLSSIPSNAIINSAILYAYLAVGNQHGGSPSSYIYRATAPWIETAVNWNTQPPPLDPTSIYKISVPAPPTITSDMVVTVTTLVQNMITYGNYGFIWRIQNEVPSNRMMFASSDNTEASDWPKLIVDYTLGAVSTTYYIRDAAGNVIATYKK